MHPFYNVFQNYSMRQFANPAHITASLENFRVVFFLSGTDKIDEQRRPQQIDTGGIFSAASILLQVSWFAVPVLLAWKFRMQLLQMPNIRPFPALMTVGDQSIIEMHHHVRSFKGGL